MQNSFYKLQNMMKQMRNSSVSLMEFSTLGYMWTVVDSSVLVVSHTIYSMLEKEPFSEFFTTQSWKSHIHSKDLNKLTDAEEELLKTGNPTTTEYRLITEKGKHIYVQHHMYLSVSPTTRWKIMSIVHNITEHKRAEVILEAMNEGFFELDESFVIRRINDHALKFWDLQHKETAGKKLYKVFPQIDGSAFHRILLTAQAEKNNMVQDIEDPVTGHWLHLSLTPYADALIVTFYDIENEKEAQKKIGGLNNSLKKINDELKSFNSLAANNYVESLRHVYISLETIVTTDARNLSNSSRANLRRAQAAIQKMKLHASDIDNYLKLYDAEIKKQPLDVKNVFKDVKEKMQKKLEDSNTTINIKKLQPLFADPSLFAKLITHVIDNSIKFRKPNADPVIDISASLIADSSSNPKAKSNTTYTVITISDNGIGFNKDDADKVFELFTQLDESKHRGSGIGLAVCKKIMEMHGGFIVAESEPGNGTSINCYFPSSP
jgi:signal transduction histidine kinase